MNLDTLFDLLKPVDLPISIDEDEPSRAQMRYLEFFIAHQIYIIFKEYVSLDYEKLFDESIANQLFGLIDGTTIFHYLSIFRSLPSDSPVLIINCKEVDYAPTINEYKGNEIYDKIMENSKNWESENKYQMGYWINQFILNPFLWWYDTKEIPVRNELKVQAKALHYIEDYEGTIQTYLSRLKDGLSVGALSQMLKKVVSDISDQDADKVISAFLDRAVDEGIIVPTILHNEEEKYLCRAYRHGEDLPFGEADQYRLVYFIKSIGNKICSKDEILNPVVPDISLEKMVVLFYQMGLRKGHIFNRFLGFDKTEIIHSFLSVHGAVQGKTKHDSLPHIYSERDSAGDQYIIWLTIWLYGIGIIDKLPDHISADEDENESVPPVPIKLDEAKRYLQENKRSAASEEILRSIDSIAELITDWYNGMANQGKRRVEFRNDITTLTSCANRFVYASAIATQIHYFKNYWDKQAMYAMKEKRDSKWLVDRLVDSQDNKKYRKITIQGLHSGRKKIEWRRENKAQKIIKDVAENFLDSTGADGWIRLWNGVDTKPDRDVNSLADQTIRAEGFLFFFSACFECLRSTDFWNSGQLPKEFASYKSSFQELAEHVPLLLDSTLFNELESIARLENTKLEKKVQRLKKLVSEALFSSEQCVDNIEELVLNMDPTYTVSYKSALILDIFALNLSQVDIAMRNFWNSLPEDATKTDYNIVRFPQEEREGDQFLKIGILFGQHTSQSLDMERTLRNDKPSDLGKILYDSFETICCQLNGQISQVRGILLPHVPLGFNFKHNLQRNIEKNAENFYKNIVQPLESRYDSSLKKQLVLGLDRYTDKSILQLSQTWRKTEKENPDISGADWVTNCVVCEKGYIHFDSADSLMNRVAYSQVKIQCGNEDGLGLLIRLSDRVVCLSNNHIFQEYSLEVQPWAESAYSSEDELESNPDNGFFLQPLADILPYRIPTSTLPAKKEIVMLEPCWNGDIPYDLAKLVSLEDWDDAEEGEECQCYGCNENSQMKWTESLHVRGGIQAGYLQIAGNNEGHITEIQEGFSGGTYVGTASNGKQRIIGIHEGRFDELKKVRMIPLTAVSAAIGALSERNENDGKNA